MNLKYHFLMSLILIGFCSNPTYGLNMKRIAMFGAGFASGVVWHEASHAASIVALGGSVDQFNFTSVRGHFPSNLSQSEYESKMRIVSLAGYMGQGIASEIILQNKNWHDNDYLLGWMCMGIINNFLNPIQYYAFDQRDMDLGTYANAGGDPAIPAVLMLAHSGYSLYRIFNKTDIPLYITHNTIGLKFKF